MDSASLKIRLMTSGIAVTPAARRLLDGGTDRPLTLADYASTSGITMELEGSVWVNAPIAEHNPNFVDRPAATLDLGADGFVVRDEGREIAARPVPVPEYHDQRNRWGEPYSSYGITHSDRVRISPIEGCAFTCQFCDLPYEFRYRTKRIDGLIDAVDRARRDRWLPARHVLISGGTPRPEDFDYLRRVYEQVPAAFPDMHVDVMMVPQPDLLEARHLAEAGIHGLSINLELFDEARARRLMPRKRKLGRARYLDFIEDAVAVFGLGRVRSLLLVGLEPLESTLAGVRALAERGCDPVLSPFRPDPSTPLRKHPPPSVADLSRVHREAAAIVDDYPGVCLGPRCLPCQHNTLTFPTDVHDVSRATGSPRVEVAR